MRCPRPVLLVPILTLALACASVPAAPSAAQPAKPYRILVTNDDGVRAPGIAALVKALAPLGDITVVAPLENQSGVGHALTLSDPIYADEVPFGDGGTATALSATPATCVRVALAALMREPPDLVVSGINRGSNFGLNAYISGTVGAAREAAMHGIPAIASALDIAGHPHYEAAAAATAQVAAIVKEGGLPPGVFLNVNVPKGATTRGLRFARQSSQMGIETYKEDHTAYGRRLFWGRFEQPSGAEPGTDVRATLDGYVAVTPLVASEFDAQHYDELGARFAGAAVAGQGIKP